MSLTRRSLLGAAAAAFAAPKQFSITEHGAKPAPALSTEAIQKAIDTCAESGGGRVLIPPATFLSGGLVLKDRVELHLAEGAVLLGSPEFRHYPPRKARSRARYEDYLLTTLLFAQGADGVSVTGKGTLNGNSQSKTDFLTPERAGKHRPCLIWFDECTNVTVRGVTFTSSGFWTETYTRCRNVHIDGIKVKDSTFPNNDGCNVVDCDNALVENCDIDALDDGICLKGYTADGCRNVVIRNNRVRSLCNGIKAGTDSSGGFQNILIENNTIHQTGIAALALELTDGGTMRNIIARNLTMDTVETPIFLKLGDRNRPIHSASGNVIPATGTMEDIHISGIRATVNDAEKRNAAERAIHNYTPYASSITGCPGHLIRRISIEDVEIEVIGGFAPGTEADLRRQIPENSTKYPENRMFGVLPAWAFYLRHARGLQLSNIRLRIRQPDARPAFFLDDVHESTFERIASPSPAFHVEENCTAIRR
ncbi:MAG: glycoside hydrolase family 28 protein [Bryobacteraceae bacterium]